MSPTHPARIIAAGIETHWSRQTPFSARNYFSWVAVGMEGAMGCGTFARRTDYSRTRIAVPNSTPSGWLFPQEKATLRDLLLGT
jgi:hypothetical protein